ncbi:MAG: Rieske (2Fe-2S) protein [Bacteroidales bacterium]
MDKERYIHRKAFLRIITFGVAASFVALWGNMIGKQKQVTAKPVVTKLNAAKLGNGIFFFEHFILVKSNSSLKVFSNRCTHAGCRINQEIAGQLVCPCHGSRYEAATGKVVQGPAGIALSTIPFASDAKTGEIIIKI